ncbi:hypothetical protein OG342_09530 [Streptomyces bobili]|uniref:hypothetical protein n=1 Tax=Streptomyces bobili TaxID=67280 RepID=UPI00224F1FB8|nr:hypothetical protein [Streptomyces bobili]MCX5523100.1 hypothetical protein [Streptomyces bobili]
MSWSRGILPALAVCVLLVTGAAGCASDDASTPTGQESAISPSPVGKVLDDTDDDGRHYREVGKKGAPQVALEVEPDAEGGWDVRLNLRDFAFSPSGTQARAVTGRGLARLFADGEPLADLRDTSYRIPEGYLAHGTHQVTARLYADDGTVWAVDGKPVESTADITASEPEPEPEPGSASEPESASESPAGGPGSSSPSALSAPGTFPRTEGQGSPDRGGKAS